MSILSQKYKDYQFIQSDKPNKIKATYGHMVSCALDIQHYCATVDDCEKCYFYSELPNGHVKCIALGEPHTWEIDKMQMRGSDTE